MDLRETSLCVNERHCDFLKGKCRKGQPDHLGVRGEKQDQSWRGNNHNEYTRFFFFFSWKAMPQRNTMASRSSVTEEGIIRHTIENGNFLTSTILE